MIELQELSSKVRKALATLIADKNVTDVEIIDDGHKVVGIGYHTTLPTRDDGETWDKYLSRAKCSDASVYRSGLLKRTYDKMISLGCQVGTNDCEGCENEGVVYVD
jgi:hypothetical protein